jgi:hypothetical protein
MTARRIRLSLLATLTGWLFAMLLTLLIFELPELARNAPRGRFLQDIAAGTALWTAFTLLVSAVIWCVIVLPVAVFAPAARIIDRRRPLALASGVAAVAFIGWRIGTWGDLGKHDGSNAITSLFLTYAGFGFTFALVTTLTYARLLRRTAAE